MTATHLAKRAVIRLSPTHSAEDVRAFLQGLVTNDVSGKLPVWAGLLSAQGKAMFDFLVWDGGDSGEVLLDCEADLADDLVKRLSLYRLRRKIAIERDDRLTVHWSREPAEGRIADPRLPELGYRWLASADTAAEPADGLWLAHRLACGVTEGHAELGDILWLETNAVELNGVSFTKGCYIGQENTARMNWRQKVNRRLVVVPLDQSDEKRRKYTYADLGLAVDHLRVEDIAHPPGWLPLSADDD
ncbi:MAG: folate-binding protein [Sphingomonadaceae bacterium]|nr:folate-binding protein YgfZ [Sphingomonadaceae bacterium]